MFEQLYVTPKPGRTLIVGSWIAEGKADRRALYKDVIGFDMRPGPGVDRVIDLEEPLPYDVGQFAHVECMSVMEHSRRPWLMAQNIERLIEPGGTLHLVAPFIWRVHAYPDDYFRFTVNGLKSLFTKIEWTAEAFAGAGLSSGARADRVVVHGHPYLARTESCLFGHRL